MMVPLVLCAMTHGALLTGRFYIKTPPVGSSAIYYSDPRAAEAAAMADAETDDRVVPVPTTPPFIFPHLHVNKVANAPQVNAAKCAELEKSLKALKCSLVTYISGFPEGCECQMTKKCPAVPTSLGFEALSESDTINFPQMGDITVSLCMYWQMRTPPDNTAAIAKAKSDSIARAKKLVDDAIAASSANAAAVGNTLWAITPTPFPRV